MRETLNEFLDGIKDPMTKVLGESIVNILYAIVILIALLIAYKVSKRLIIGAMQSQQRTDNEIRQFLSDFR